MRLVELDYLLKHIHEINDLNIYKSEYLAWCHDVLSNVATAIETELKSREKKG